MVNVKKFRKILDSKYPDFLQVEATLELVERINFVITFENKNRYNDYLIHLENQYKDIYNNEYLPL